MMRHTPFTPIRAAAFTPLLMLILISHTSRALAQAPQPPTEPDIRIESFGATRAYVVGMDSVTLVATVRNAGQTALPANTVRGRMYCLAGLDYAEGDTTPWIPALDPNATTTFKWRVQPSSADMALVAAFSVETPGKLPQVRLLPLQHFSDAPRPNTGGIPAKPYAREDRDGGTLANDRMQVRVSTSESNVPALFVSARVGAGWKQTAVMLPAAQVLSAEGGQDPWWEVFRADDITAYNEKGSARLVLSGGFGLRWRASLECELKTGYPEMQMTLRLSPLRPLRVSGLRFGPLFLGDGGFGATVDEVIGPIVTDVRTVTQVRWQNVIAGASWLNKPIFPGWQFELMPNVDGADYRLMGCEMHTDAAPVALAAGALIETSAVIRAQGPTPPPPPKPKPKPKPEPERRRPRHRRHR